MYFALQFLPGPYYWAGILLSGIMSLSMVAIANDHNLWNLSPHTIGSFALGKGAQKKNRKYFFS